MDIQAVKELVLPSIEQEYGEKDAILYALSLGYGNDPLDDHQLKFVYEDGLNVVPSICVVLAHPGFWVKRPELKLDWRKLLHGEQSFEIHAPFPPKARVCADYEIVAIEDKGQEKGAILYLEKRLFDAASKRLLATIRSTLFLRGDGGCGSFGVPPIFPSALDRTKVTSSVDLSTLPQSALIYRLNGDYNPIHVDPGIAKESGFGRPILHGLCTMGLATRVIIEHCCDMEPTRLRSMSVRFSKPVFPGETIRFEFYRTGEDIRFTARVLERDVLVLDRGYAQVETSATLQRLPGEANRKVAVDHG